MRKKSIKNVIFGCIVGALLCVNPIYAETVDWLVLYDEKSKQYYNGDPDTAMQNWVSRINGMYSKSQVDIQLRLVGVLPLATKGNDQSEVLHNVRADKEANRLRDEAGADIVTQLFHEGNCGIGFVSVSADYAWNVVRASCGSATTAAHELGHNMGLNHSRRQGNTKGSRYEYGLGYGIDNKFATIMAYAQSFNSRRINQFSNPNLRCSGEDCGVPVGQPEQANAALALQNSRIDVSNFRPTRVTNRNPHQVYIETTKTEYNYDFGTVTSPVMSGWTRISPETNGDISWSGLVSSRDRGEIDGVNKINRDFVFSNNKRVLRHKISNGTWAVTINMGDATNPHDNMQVSAEGKVKHRNVSSLTREFSYANFEIVVNDGELNFEFSDNGGSDVNWVLNRLSLKKVKDPTNQVVHLTKRNAAQFAIDGSGNSSNGQNIYLWNQNPSNRFQQWVEISRGNGFYSYKKNGTNFCLDGGNGGRNGQIVYLWQCTDSNQNQHWKKVDRGSEHFSLEKRNAPDFSIDGGTGGTRLQDIHLWRTEDSNQNQHWSFN